jgi:hypothetical protein
MSTPDPLPRRSGVHTIDIFVGACALLISAVSLFMAYRSNQVQDRMLEASIWPYLDWDDSNFDEQRRVDQVSLGFKNVGVGPARIETFRLSYKGQPLADFKDMVQACCKAETAPLKHWNSQTSGINPAVIPAHDEIRFFAIDKNEQNAALWDKLNQERFNLEAQVCYCSVLEDCWLFDSSKQTPDKVEKCPVPSGPQYH